MFDLGILAIGVWKKNPGLVSKHREVTLIVFRLRLGRIVTTIASRASKKANVFVSTLAVDLYERGTRKVEDQLIDALGSDDAEAFDRIDWGLVS